MTHQEMIDYVAGQLRNTKIQSLITSWLNLAIDELGNSYVFGHLNKYGSKNTAAGVPDVILDTNFHWLKIIQIPLDSRKLYPYDESMLAESYPDYRTNQGEVTHYYLNGQTLGLWHVPSGIKAITYSYQGYPLHLSALGDISDLPIPWHELVAQKAVTKGFAYQRDQGAKKESEASESKLLFRVNASLYKRPDDKIVLGGLTHRKRPPYPKLPSNYPRRRF
jgi:hypothetical protein